MNARGAMVLVSLFLLGACAGGGGERPPPLDPTTLIPPAPTYPDVTTFALYWGFGGVRTDVTIDRNSKVLAGSPGGTQSGQIAASASGLTTLSLNVTGIAGVTFAQTFQAADLAIATPIPGQAPRTLLSGTKTASDGSVRALTILDTATAGFHYMVLGSWEYASAPAATSAVGSSFVIGPETRSADLPLAGTAAYSGVMFGRYADGATLWSATASANALADFGNRTVSFSTAGTQIASPALTQAAPQLDLVGTLSYPAATNNLTGTLSTASGLTGQSMARFFGPAAAEIGGTFFVQNGGNTQQMTGSFGLKQ